MAHSKTDDGGTRGACPIGVRRIVAVVLAAAIVMGVLVPAGIWFWSSVLERMARAQTALIHAEAGDKAFEQKEYFRAMTAYAYARDMNPTPENAKKFMRARLFLGSVRPDLLARWDREDLEYQRAFLAGDETQTAAVIEVLEGHLRRMAGNIEAAKERYKAALSRDEQCLGAHLGLGLVAYRAGKADEAKSELGIVLKALPEHREAALALADVHLAEDDADAAIHILKRLLEAGQDAEVHQGLGLAYQRKNQVREAATHFQMAVQLNPTSRDSHLALGELYLNSELYALAESSFRAAANISQDETVLTGLARSLSGQRRYDEAMRAIGPVLQRGNSGPLALIAAAEAASGLGRKDDARRLYEEALRFIEKLEGRGDPKVVQALKREVQNGLRGLESPDVGTSNPPTR